MPPTIDDVRAYWDANPCNIRHSPLPVGTQGYFDAVERRRRLVEPHLIAFADYGRWKGKRVLDVGCGIGTDAVGFARAGADVTGVDLSPNSIDLAKRRFDIYELPGRFLVADIEHLPSVLKAQEYDLIYASGVLHHTPDPRRAVHALARYAGAETELRAVLYAMFSWKIAMLFLKHGFGAAAHTEAAAGSPISRVYTAGTVRRLLSPDFTMVDLEKTFIFPYRVDKYVRYEYQKPWYFEMLPEPVFTWLEHRLGWHFLATARRS